MTGQLFFALLVFAWLLVQAQGATACHSVSSDRITGEDLAAAVPELRSLPPDLVLGYSPFPGSVRVFKPLQLLQIARKYNLPVADIYSPVCFAWTLRTLSRKEIMNAINQTLAGRKADVVITDQSRMPVPIGDLALPLNGLTGDSARPAIWNGYVTYAGGRKFNTWVEVQITVHEHHFVAARPIQAGEQIDATAVKEIEYTGPLQRTGMLPPGKMIVGQCARWPIASGTVLTESMLCPPLAVTREQMVTVLIACGAAHIETQGIADDSGYIGSIIRVRNTKTGRVFRARIDDRGVVTVVAGGPIGLVVDDGKS